MAISKKATAKTVTKKSAKVSPSMASTMPRRLRLANYRSFRLSKRLKPAVRKPLPSSSKLFKLSILHLKSHAKLFGGIIAVYGLLYVVLVQGIGSGLNLGDLKNSLQSISKGHYSQLSTGLVLFGALVSSINNTSSAGAGVYQSILLVVVSLALIWALRESRVIERLRIRDGFYRGMTPLVPFVLVLMIIGLQLIPLIVGSAMYSLVVSNSIAITALEKFMWGTLFFLLAVLSLYMMTSSLFALYIVTLPGMTPLKAIRSARQLVLHRRWMVLRKILFLPFILLILAAIIIIPLILWVTPLATWIFFVFTMISLALVHSYTYTLYRELL